jgi:uncharacterized protein YndB with AHSA1/START domain
MIKALKIVLVVVAILGVAFVGIGFALPSDYQVERSVVIDADSPRVHAYVGNLARWPDWTPWQDADPTVRITRGARTSGVGAHQSWVGDGGSGELTFTESSPQTGIVYDLSFDEGAYRSEAAMRYHAEGTSTRVTWTMEGDVGMNIVGRYFAFMMDSMVGPMFESGLADLKTNVEKDG